MNSMDQQNILLLYTSTLLYQQDNDYYAFSSSDLTVHLAMDSVTLWHSRNGGEMELSYSRQVS